jgi:NADPH:quinone reductase-like Zn-dependent oxidoreductase
MNATSMKAIVYERYRPPDVLQLKGVDKPIPKNNEILIKIHAASVNPLDWHYLRGTPHLMRLIAGLLRPKNK